MAQCALTGEILDIYAIPCFGEEWLKVPSAEQNGKKWK